MRRLLAKRWLVGSVIVLVPLAAGIVYAVLTGRSSAGLEENRAALAAAGVYPGAREVGRGSTSMFPENALPVPRGLVTTVAYEPPAATTQNEVVDFYLARLRGRWSPKVERSLLGTTGERSFRVTFTEDDRCLALLTAGLLVAVGQQRVYTLSAYEANGGSC